MAAREPPKLLVAVRVRDDLQNVKTEKGIVVRLTRGRPKYPQPPLVVVEALTSTYLYIIRLVA